MPDPNAPTTLAMSHIIWLHRARVDTAGERRLLVCRRTLIEFLCSTGSSTVAPGRLIVPEVYTEPLTRCCARTLQEASRGLFDGVLHTSKRKPYTRRLPIGAARAPHEGGAPGLRGEIMRFARHTPDTALNRSKKSISGTGS